MLNKIPGKIEQHFVYIQSLIWIEIQATSWDPIYFIHHQFFWNPQKSARTSKKDLKWVKLQT